MNNITDEQILAAVGRAWDKFSLECGLQAEIKPLVFLDRLIPVDKPWNPMELKHGDKYWTVEHGGEAFSCTWLKDSVDKWRRAIGACHPTKEAAETWYRKLMNN